MNAALLNELLIEQARDLYAATAAEVDLLPRLLRAASLPALRDQLSKRIELARRRMGSIDRLFARLGAAPTGGRGAAMHGMAADILDLLAHGSGAYPEAVDPRLAAALRKIGHHALASLRSLEQVARCIGADEIDSELTDAIALEAAAERELAEVAADSLRWTCATASDEIPAARFSARAIPSDELVASSEMTDRDLSQSAANLEAERVGPGNESDATPELGEERLERAADDSLRSHSVNERDLG